MRLFLLYATLLGGSTFFSRTSADLLWPTPTSITYAPTNVCVTIDTPNLQCQIVNGDSTDILTDSLRRYSSIFQITVPSVGPFNCSSTNSVPITLVTINITNPSLSLTLNTSEAYSMVIPSSGGTTNPITLQADTVFGILIIRRYPRGPYRFVPFRIPLFFIIAECWWIPLGIIYPYKRYTRFSMH